MLVFGETVGQGGGIEDDKDSGQVEELVDQTEKERRMRDGFMSS